MDLLFFSIIVLIISAVAHEMAHGYAADLLGDPTPRIQGRLTINPIKHLEFVGSFLLPFITYNIGGFIFGWAKPVEFNPNNLKNPKRDEILIALAGPLSNALIALFFGLIVRYSEPLGLSMIITTLFSVVVMINLSLMIFNLIPIPPLDGSKILLNSIPDRYYEFKQAYIRSSLIIFIVFLVIGSQFITPVIQKLFSLLTGYIL